MCAASSGGSVGGEQVSQQPPPSFETKWKVQSDSRVPLLRVKVPRAHGQPKPPPFLRLDARRGGVLGRFTKRPVLRPIVAAGGTDPKLTVSASLKLAIGEKRVTVSEATEKSYRWYRLSRSTGSLVAAVATIIGAALLTVGALSPKSGLGIGLLIAGGALTLVAVFAVVRSAWKAPIDPSE
jgi:hypothetical protein